MIASAFCPPIRVSVTMTIVGLCHNTRSNKVDLNLGFITPLQFHINIFIIGLEEVLESNQIRDGSSPISLNFHACINGSFILSSPENNVTACLRIPLCSTKLLTNKVHSITGKENWRSFTWIRLPITTHSVEF